MDLKNGYEIKYSDPILGGASLNFGIFTTLLGNLQHICLYLLFVKSQQDKNISNKETTKNFSNPPKIL